ncbi:Hypothetical predicted protein [Lecanosticta acicola]|uniref:Uncharacterized protein n=1 Tax=Lecanosticta acicola TaxID=111012 RepID=A0AAI8YZJ1_9PEZI|nr:Hypothetical predicted protein [Lecanosticta acicola]
MAHVTASMQAFLRQQGVAEEVLALFTAEVILANAVEEMESRGLAAALLPPDATVVDQAVRQVSRSSSPVSTMEMDGQQQLGEQLSPAPSRSQSPEAAASDDSDSERASRSASPQAPPSSSSAFPLVEASPLARLTAAPKSVSRVPNPKYTTFQRDESETFRFLSTRLASAMVALHRVTRTGDALVLGQFGVDFLGRENLFTSLEFYLGTDTDEDDEEGEGGDEVSEGVGAVFFGL